MLSVEQNEMITHVGAGTMMGELLREYWIPALLSKELSEPECSPVRIRLLGEDLIAFRATSGRVGLFANACPHRGASMFYGRPEDDGLRCVYHGWLFDVDGNCLDMPSEPADSNFATKVKARAYPCVERGGAVWTYMGPREVPPPLPDIEPNMKGESCRAVFIDCNWVQAIENNMDTTHFSFLHFGAVDADAPPASWWTDSYLAAQGFEYMIKTRGPVFLMTDTDSGASYAAQRPAEADTYHYSIMNYHVPFFTQSPRNDWQATGFGATVPIDDTHTMSWSFSLRDKKRTGGQTVGAILPENTNDWLGRFRRVVTAENDYGVDRDIQKDDKTWSGYTGIVSMNDQDWMIVEAQGTTVDRSLEHLGTTDRMIIRMRQLLIQEAIALREDGTPPRGVDNPEIYRLRSGSLILPREVDVWEGTKDMREAFQGEKV